MKRFKYVVNTNIFRNIKTSAEIVGVDGIEWGLKTLDRRLGGCPEIQIVKNC